MKILKLSSLLIAILAAGSLASAADNDTNAAPSAAPPTATVATDAVATPDAVPDVTPTNGLYLNFRDVPLSAVLNYLSAKAGLIVISDADLRGKVSVVAKQPVTTNDLVEMLNDALSKNGYAATLNGRTLNVMELSRAKTSANTPIIPETNVTSIPMTDEVVTGILPMASLNPTQLIKDLEPLIPSGDTVIANEGGNAIIMTAPQKDIHRIAQIISDLDSSSISDVEVFVLKYGDAKSVASELKEVFESADSDVARANTRNSFRRGGGGGGGFGGLFGGGFGGGGGGAGGGGGGDDQTGRNAQTHAVFTSDDLMNAVIASAPPSYMASVTNVINELDQPTDQITVMRVFKLKNADPTEVADEFTTLFQITSSSDQNNNNRSMGMRFVPPWMQQQPASSGQSDRMKRETAVNVVADRRIQAVIITASKDQMDEIAGVVASLDEGNSGVQHVKAFNIDGDPTYMQTVLNTLFSNPAHPQPATSTTTDPFAARQTATANSQQSATSQTTSGFGTTGGSSAP